MPFSHATFRATRALAPREGLTIVVGFPKGIVAAPNASTRATWFLRDNGGVLVGGIGLLLMWAYYFFEWVRVGRDPKPGVIIPEYEAPEGLSPGTLRHQEEPTMIKGFAGTLIAPGHESYEKARKVWNGPGDTSPAPTRSPPRPQSRRVSHTRHPETTARRRQAG